MIFSRPIHLFYSILFLFYSLFSSTEQISRKQMDLMKKLKVTFVGEPGLDMGGLTKEWFLLLIKEIFSQNYGWYTPRKRSLLMRRDVDYNTVDIWRTIDIVCLPSYSPCKYLSYDAYCFELNKYIHVTYIFFSGTGMFVYHKQSRCYWFSTTQSGNLREYHLIGVVSDTLLKASQHSAINSDFCSICISSSLQLTGLAVYNSIILELNFPIGMFRYPETCNER